MAGYNIYDHLIKITIAAKILDEMLHNFSVVVIIYIIKVP
jgi:hypothetical protein